MEYSYGCLEPKIDIRDYELCSSANPNVTYPEKFELSDLPKVKNQLNVSSCVAHATSSILEYYAKNKYNLSTNFIYGIRKKMFNQMGYGMYLRDACEIARVYGDFLEEDCKGNTEIPNCYNIAEQALNNDKATNKAYKFRIDSYYLCRNDNDIKYALMNYGPVLAGIMWHDVFTLDENNIIHFDTRSNKGGHATMCIGWDNNKGWLIQNSWGTEFGDNGKFYLPFSYGFYEARALVDSEASPDDIALMKTSNTTPLWIVKICNFLLNLFKFNKVRM